LAGTAGSLARKLPPSNLSTILRGEPAGDAANTLARHADGIVLRAAGDSRAPVPWGMLLLLYGAGTGGARRRARERLRGPGRCWALQCAGSYLPLTKRSGGREWLQAAALSASFPNYELNPIR
jgi:hypothetical protein